jgi:hypothetical protein
LSKTRPIALSGVATSLSISIVLLIRLFTGYNIKDFAKLLECMAHSEGSFHRTFFPYRYRAEYEIELPLAPTFVCRMFDALGRHLSEDVFERESFKNIKGRDSSQKLLDDSSTPEANEIVFAKGVIYELSEDSEKVERGPFRCSITSPYKSSKAGDIFHAKDVTRSGELPDYVAVQEAGRIFPAELSYFRLGIQKYSSRMLSSLVGLAPVITGSLLIDCNKDSLKLRLVDEALNSKKAPWFDEPYLWGVHSALHFVCDFDLLASIEEQLGVSY